VKEAQRKHAELKVKYPSRKPLEDEINRARAKLQQERQMGSKERADLKAKIEEMGNSLVKQAKAEESERKQLEKKMWEHWEPV
jgi:hypothetical protein